MCVDSVILDTNVFVAAGFKRRSSSAEILDQVRHGGIRMIWNTAIRRETQAILQKIPRLSWESVADLFRDEERYDERTFPERFDFVRDPDDRKFAALAAATQALLVTSDDDLLSCRDRVGVTI